jgi:predicted DNA-binding transcriptional regulator YafY
MYYPSTRLLSILDLLRARGQLKATDLSQYLEVDVRTVRRYIVMLQDLGMPVETVHGRHGGYCLRAGYRMPPIAFSDDELLALTLGMLYVRKLGLAGTVKAADVAIDKMTQAMPESLRQQVQVLDQTLLMEMAVPNLPVTSATIFTLSMATYQRRRLWMHYRSREQRETERHFDPYQLVSTIGLWYVIGYCHLRQDIRTFRLDRIQALHLCDDTFTRPVEFNAWEGVRQSIARTPGTWLAEVLLLTTMEEAKRLVSSAMAVLRADPQGVLMYCYVEDLANLAHFLLGLECTLVVRQPPELRNELQMLAAKAMKLANSAP